MKLERLLRVAAIVCLAAGGLLAFVASFIV